MSTPMYQSSKWYTDLTQGPPHALYYKGKKFEILRKLRNLKNLVF